VKPVAQAQIAVQLIRNWHRIPFHYVKLAIPNKMYRTVSLAPHTPMATARIASSVFEMTSTNIHISITQQNNRDVKPDTRCRVSETSTSFLGSTAQLRPWPPPQNPAEFLGGFSTIFFFTG
jgi:hypothetical protein